MRHPPVLVRGVVDSWHYAISTRAHGIGFDDLPVADVALTLPSLLTALDAIGGIDLAGTAGYGIWTPDGQAPYDSWPDALMAIGTETARVPGWRAALANSEFGLGPVEAGLAALAALAPYLPDERHMIHGDLLSHNVLAAGGTVTAVLDWGNALYGDSLYDAAWLIYWWPWYPRWRGVDIYAVLPAHWRAAGPLPAHLRERLHAYLIHIGLDAIAYRTFQRRWDEVRSNAGIVATLAHSAPGEYVLNPPLLLSAVRQPCGVLAGAGVAAHADQGDAVEGGVGGPVAASGEAVAVGSAAGGGDPAGSAEVGEGGPGPRAFGLPPA